MKEKMVMGWDAAWTPEGSGAWCMLRLRESRAEVMHLEPTPHGEEKVLEALRNLLEKWRPVLIAVDMPVADVEIAGYREADRASTKVFGRHGCPVHSPTPKCPGKWGWEICKHFHQYYYKCHTSGEVNGLCFAEVYPHTALLKLLRLPYRFPYKVGRASAYWPEYSLPQRRVRIEQAFRQIETALLKQNLLFEALVYPRITSPWHEWKQVEDQLDALICAWSAAQILNNQFIPLGNQHSAIWHPIMQQVISDSNTQ